MATNARNIMEIHHMLAHPSKDITRKTAEAIEISTMGQWGSRKACLQVKVKQHTMPKMTDNRASVKGQRFFVNV